ncbi:MAG: hypothetical protein GAK35_02304 [Herbaspirillum frisingense]|uniref:Uncharacterized protein n=1 Tax=Herbaspirillum frisingense TaxID=92645 RepID=A0A7V8FWP4_9BURK|nr:MAG: hypothetical protein GAK35_02304 [Herbaspirillum frisingense]
MQQAGGAIGDDVDPACQADPFAPSGVTATQILVHHEEFAAYTRKLELLQRRWVNYSAALQGDAK